MGLLVIGLNVIRSAWIAAPFLILLGAIGGYLVVPMNALLQHRGANLMGAGRSIAVQNFNEQACILGLGAFYTGMTRFGLSAFTRDHRVRRARRGDDVADPALACSERACATPTRSRTCCRSRASTSIDWRAGPTEARGAAGERRAGRQRLGLGHVVVAVSQAPGGGPASALGHDPDLHASLRSSSSRFARAPRASCCARRRCGCSSLAAGTTNAAFNWAIVIGDVVRVVLLFYLMPLWTVLLARFVLGERLTPAAALRIGLALAGAAIVLWPDASAAGARPAAAASLPLPHSLADWLGVVGGFSFAFNNVMLRREAERPEEGRALAMFAGGAVVAGVLADEPGEPGRAPWLPAPAAAWLLLTAGLAVLFIAGNLALQYGAARLAANRTAVVMLTEVVFASASAIAFGGGAMTEQLAVGGGLIVASALLAAFGPAQAH